LPSAVENQLKVLAQDVLARFKAASRRAELYGPSFGSEENQEEETSVGVCRGVRKNWACKRLHFPQKNTTRMEG